MMVIPPPDHVVLGAAAERRLAASSTLEILDGFLHVCVLASRRQRPTENTLIRRRNH
jgi:hypothetical protein